MTRFTSPLMALLTLLLLTSVISQDVKPVVQPGEWRYINNSNNNLGARYCGAYSDMIPYDWLPNRPANFLQMRPTPREVSNMIFSKPAQGNRRSLNIFFLLFISSFQNDIGSMAYTNTSAPPMITAAPRCDALYDSRCTGNATISLTPFAYLGTRTMTVNNVTKTFQTRLNPRTPHLDLEDIYRYLYGRENHRTYVDGKLEPFSYYTKNINLNVYGYVWNDLWNRLHNWLCDDFKKKNPTWNDEQLFQNSRKWAIAYGQKILSREYAAAFLGTPLSPYKGYQPDLDCTPDLWAVMVLRYGHYEVPGIVPFMDDKLLIDKWWLNRERTFNLNISDSDMEKLVRGAVYTEACELGTGSYPDMRGAMFNTDFLMRDVWRGRELGIPPYNEMRAIYGLPPVKSFAEFTDDPELLATLNDIYGGDIGRFDALVGAWWEKHLPGASCGPLVKETLMRFYERMRNSDRFWYEAPGVFTPEELTQIYGTSTYTIMTNIFPNIGFNESGILNPFFKPNRQINSTSTLFPVFLDPLVWKTLDMSSVYRLSWSTTTAQSEGMIEFVVQVKTFGWVGIGFKSDENTMKNGDILILRDRPDINSTAFEILDCYALEVGVPTLDIELGGTNDVVPISYQQISGVKIFRFKRKWETGDEWDKPLTPHQQNKVIFSFNTETLELLYHGPARSAAARVDFNQGEILVVRFSSTLTIVACVLAGVSIAYALSVMFCIFKFNSIFRHLSYRFCLLICLGFVLGHIAVILYSLNSPTRETCLAFIWLLGFSFVLVFCSIFLKALRLWEIFRAVKKNQVSKEPMKPFTDEKLFVLLGIFTGLEFALLLAWTLADPLEPKTVLVENNTELNIRCKSDSLGWWIAFVVYKLVVMFAGSFFVIELRDMKDSLSESKRVIFTLILTFLTSLIACIVGFFLNDKEYAVEVTLIVFTILFVYNLSAMVLFMPLIYGILMGSISDSRVGSKGSFAFNVYGNQRHSHSSI